MCEVQPDNNPLIDSAEHVTEEDDARVTIIEDQSGVETHFNSGDVLYIDFHPGVCNTLPPVFVLHTDHLCSSFHGFCVQSGAARSVSGLHPW